MRATAISLCLLIVVTAGCATGRSFVKPGYDFSNVKRVAVGDVLVARRGRAVQDEITDLFGMELLARGFDVVERSQVRQILKEQRFQSTGTTSPVDAVKMGRILNVDAIVVVNVPVLREHISMTAKMIDVETGTLLWMGEGTGKVGSGLATLGGALIGAGAGAAVGHQIDHRRGAGLGAVAGGLAGGIAGHALEPTLATALRNVVTKVARGMPARY